MTPWTALLVAVAGAGGSVLRWWLSRLDGVVPWGTLAANAVGSLALGVLVGLARTGRGGPGVLLVLGGGLLGGLTTFSTLALQVWRSERPRWGYLASSLVLGLVLAAAGLSAGAALGRG